MLLLLQLSCGTHTCSLVVVVVAAAVVVVAFSLPAIMPVGEPEVKENEGE